MRSVRNKRIGTLAARVVLVGGWGWSLLPGSPLRRAAVPGLLALALLVCPGQEAAAQAAAQPDVGAFGSFERDTETPAEEPESLALQVYVLDGWALAIQPDDRYAGPPAPHAAVGDDLRLISRSGRHVSARIADRGYFRPRDPCEIRRGGWAYVLDVDDPEALQGEEPEWVNDRAFMATRPDVEGRPFSPVDPARAESVYPAFRADLEERAQELRQQAAESRFLEEAWIERLIELMLGPEKQDRFIGLEWSVRHASFQGPDGRLNLITDAGGDDPHDRSVGTWFTYLFHDDGTVEARITGAHFPQAIVIDPQLGHEIILTTTGFIRPENGEWQFPAPDDPQRCT